MEHTPEPWNIDFICEHEGFGWSGNSFDKADRLRIVQCVNACAGMDDPEEEIKSLRERVKELECLIENMVVCPHCEGKGWTDEHDPNDPHIDGQCNSCPVQMPCHICDMRGVVDKQIVPQTQEIIADDLDLPF